MMLLVVRSFARSFSTIVALCIHRSAPGVLGVLQTLAPSVARIQMITHHGSCENAGALWGDHLPSRHSVEGSDRAWKSFSIHNVSLEMNTIITHVLAQTPSVEGAVWGRLPVVCDTFPAKENSSSANPDRSRTPTRKAKKRSTERSTERSTMTTTAAPPGTTGRFVDADPYQWPYNGKLTKENTCIIVIGERDCKMRCICVAVAVAVLVVQTGCGRPDFMTLSWLSVRFV